MESGSTKVQTTLPDEIADEVLRLARIEKRSLSNMIAVLITEAISHRPASENDAA